MRDYGGLQWSRHSSCIIVSKPSFSNHPTTVKTFLDAVDQKLDSIAQQNLTFFESLRALANATEELQKESRIGVIENCRLLQFLRFSFMYFIILSAFYTSLQKYYGKHECSRRSFKSSPTYWAWRTPLNGDVLLFWFLVVTSNMTFSSFPNFEFFGHRT